MLIPLDDVRKEWMPKHYPDQVQTMASYYGIFDHMLEGKCFRPSVVMDVNYNEDEVHYGNFLQPEKVPQFKLKVIKSKIQLHTSITFLCRQPANQMCLFSLLTTL